jgi:hypothetical protein
MMKLIRCVLLGLIASVLVACGGGGGSSGVNPNASTLTTTAGASVILAPGAFQTYDVLGGVPPYRTDSSERAIVVSNINDSKLSIGAVTGGSATVSVIDSSGKSVAIAVKVGSSIPLFSTAPATVNLRAPGQMKTCAGGAATAGETASFAITGGSKPYTVTSAQPQFVTAEMVDTSHFKVSSIARGTATVTIQDSVGATLTVSVNSGTLSGASALVNSLTDVKISIGVESRVLITGGVPPYMISGNIPATVTVTPSCSDTGEFFVTGNLAGKFEISFMDSLDSIAPKTTFEFMPDAASFRASPGSFVMSENDTQDFIEYQLFGFTGDTGTSVASGEVCIYISDPSYFQLDPSRATCSTFSGSNRKFRLIKGTRGSWCVPSTTSVSLQIIDSRGFIATGFTDDNDKLVRPQITILNNGTSCEAGVSNTGALTAAPTSVSLSAASTTGTVAILGGSGSYIVSSSNPAVATAAAAGNIVTVTRVAAGSATITVLDSGNPTKSVTISVTSI